jgi:hypothetical protein
MIEVIVAGIAAVASIVAAILSAKGARQGKTTNGHQMGELVEGISDRLARMEIWHVEHLRDHVNHAREKKSDGP